MCGRFGSSFTGEELSGRFELSSAAPRFDRSYNIAPGSHIPVVTRNSPNKAQLMRWGFVPEWADPVKLKFHPINARDDKVESGFYRSAFATNRCLIPFSFFFEWKKFTMDGKEVKQPYLIRVIGEEIMGFAGIYSAKKDAEDRPVYTCAIITTKPNSLMKKIHNRMPVIIDKSDEDAWLDVESDLVKIKKLLKPFDASKMESYKVSKEVNNPRNDSSDLIQKLS